MPQPAEFLEYPHRAYGMDQDRYDWQPADRRAPVQLKSGARAMAFITIPLEFFPLDPPAKPFKHPGAMVTPYPDLRHYTTRDYGNRVGVFRLLKELESAGLKATFAVNAEVARRYAPLIERIRQGGHEIAAHGVSTAHIHHAGLSEEEERALVAQTRAALPDAVTWMSPARNQSFRTPDLVREAGFTTCLDWESDQRPLPMRTAHGPLSCLPNHYELSDFLILGTRSQSEDEWADQILEAAAQTVAEYASRGAQCFGFTLTPYITGLPFRIEAVTRVLKGLAAMDGLEVATAASVTSAFEGAAP
ncbi:polysaccharide deacetylase family protein [Hyphomonas neptunium ATCC 15444]|uniref:Chitooligosaccharide deacetylase n=2 Tax=Hyphomonas TaxID=85 RepID=Q0C358_HYPNA|nr:MULTISPECIES: polysaccharide deacetylase family protein [Hyphomonas]ABI78138.1 polysaccharide deacetylase family protein [Hyphomonas neptunium ATCC 15444]KCZ95930.1 polysaccharide deacetylase family protein [Hyphomonas hirschiana VP5]